jgi:hypothetical protein
MFGLFKPKLAPVGPYAITVDCDVQASADEVFALLDFADPRNAQVARGASVKGDGSHFEMTVPQLPKHVFHIAVIEHEAPNHYGYDIVTEPAIGALARSREVFTVWDLPGGGCRVRLEAAMTLRKGVREKRLVNEIAMMTIGCHNSLAKLKLQIEQGLDAVVEADARLVA